ncbi:DUF645 family protein [Vibrio cholerae]
MLLWLEVLEVQQFENRCIIAVIWFSLSRTLNRSQLNLDRFKF